MDKKHDIMYLSEHQHMAITTMLQYFCVRKLSFSRGFSLIELLITISVFAILLSLLSPSLKNMMNKAMTNQCFSQLGGQGVNSTLYIDDHGDRFPYPGYIDLSSLDHKAKADETFGISWDDLLGLYDGRDLSYSDMTNTDGFYIETTKNNPLRSDDFDIPSTYKCPFDETIKTKFADSIGETRSYAMNAFYKSNGTNNSPGPSRAHFEYQQISKGMGAGKYSAHISEVEDPSGTIFLAEIATKYSVLGSSRGVDVIAPSKTFENDEGEFSELHPQGSFNYLFSDLHVENLLPQETCEPTKVSSLREANKMWTREAD